MAKGIYKITNDRTGEVYVGQSNNMYHRYLQHMNELDNGTHHNRGMQTDYNRGDKFSFEILELVDGSKKDLYEHEKIQKNTTVFMQDTIKLLVENMINLKVHITMVEEERHHIKPYLYRNPGKNLKNKANPIKIIPMQAVALLD